MFEINNINQEEEEGEEEIDVDANEEIKNLEEEFASEEVGTKSEEIPQWEKDLQDELQVSYILHNFYAGGYLQRLKSKILKQKKSKIEGLFSAFG